MSQSGTHNFDERIKMHVFPSFILLALYAPGSLGRPFRQWKPKTKPSSSSSSMEKMMTSTSSSSPSMMNMMNMMNMKSKRSGVKSKGSSKKDKSSSSLRGVAGEQVCKLHFETKTLFGDDLTQALNSGFLSGGCNSLCDLLCNDGNSCTIDDSPQCEETGCTPVAERPLLDCSDGISCTDDSCDPETGCVSIPNDSLCISPPDSCFTTNGRCSLESGGCLYEPDDSKCDDGQKCTEIGCLVKLTAGVNNRATSNLRTPFFEDASRAFDNIPCTKWLGFLDGEAPPYILQKNFIPLNNFENDDPGPVVVAYSVTSANDFPERNPMNWTLFGDPSIEAIDPFFNEPFEPEVVLDARSGIMFSGFLEEKLFFIDEPKPYDGFALYIDANNGAEDAVQVAELTFYVRP